MLDKIQQAAERLRPYLRPTPLIESEPLSRALDHPVWLKIESLQPTGAFKVRPALNGMLLHLEQARRCGVVTSSSGNFAQAAAFAGSVLGIDTQIVMMRGASRFKRERARHFGGVVVDCDDTFESRWQTTFRIQRESGRLLLHPYDSEETIAGDGTVGLEVLEQLPGEFAIAVPVSGGGLIGGIAAAVKTLRPGCRVIGVQPEANPSMLRSLEAGRRMQLEPRPSIADALVILQPGERTFPLAQRYVDEVALVSEEELAGAVRLLAVEQKLVVEPGGAAGVAALLAGKVDRRGLPVVAVLSGGNIVPERLRELLGSSASS